MVFVSCGGLEFRVYIIGFRVSGGGGGRVRVIIVVFAFVFELFKGFSV